MAWLHTLAYIDRTCMNVPSQRKCNKIARMKDVSFCTFSICISIWIHFFFQISVLSDTGFKTKEFFFWQSWMIKNVHTCSAVARASFSYKTALNAFALKLSFLSGFAKFRCANKYPVLVIFEKNDAIRNEMFKIHHSRMCCWLLRKIRIMQSVRSFFSFFFISVSNRTLFRRWYLILFLT